MRRFAVVVVVALSVAAGGVWEAPSAVKPPEVAIFFYGWWGNPVQDGGWLHWGQASAQPPATVASSFYPARGPYSSADPAILAAQMREIAAIGIDTIVVSWWGPGSLEDRRLDLVGSAARRARLRVAIQLEPWQGRTATTAAAAILQLAERGVRDIYVYDSTTIADEEWAPALAPLEGVRVFANTMLPGRARRGGFDGLYSYDTLVYDGRSFRRVCAAARRIGLLCAPSVGPGFDGRRGTPVEGVAPRRDGKRYDTMWRQGIEARPDIVTITSYNEWHEGTQIEGARAGVTGFESYEGAYGKTGRAAERAYLDRTAYWITRLRSAR